MNKPLKRYLHLGVLVALGAVLSTGSHALAANPTPVSVCGPLAADTSYYLTQNLLNVSGTCFTVGNNTSLDLRNHTIKGDGTGFGVTDNGGAAANVVIVNGTIKNFDGGIVMYECCGSFDLSVDNVNASSNTEVGIFSLSCCNMVTNVKANSNGEAGIVFVEDGCCNTFSNVSTSSNGGVGLLSEDCCSLAFGVTANGNDGPGIEMVDGASKVEGSTANGNAGDGIEMNNGDNVVESSTANGNSVDGIFAGQQNNLVDHATANGNQGDGIAAGSGSNLVSNSVASQNGSDGIVLNGSNANILMRDTTASNAFFGVDLDCGANAGEVVRLNSHNNLSKDLCESGGTCTNVNNSAANQGC